MPKTSSFKVQVMIVKEYFEYLYGENYEEYEDDYFDSIWKDPRNFIKPGMIFTMNYTQTKNYAKTFGEFNYVLENVSTVVTVESITFFIDEEPDIYITAILKTDKPIFICAKNAVLGRGITLHTEHTTIASGGVEDILDKTY
jgi:hypothetical protein